MAGTPAAHRAVETFIREEWGRVQATLVGMVRDFALAEDALQDAVIVAMDRWAADGIPDNPRAWLIRTARNKAIDRLRRNARLRTKQDEMQVLAELDAATVTPEIDEDIPDERLRLIFTCCHPALPEEAHVALTLRTLGGLATGEIARAFLVPEATMAQRLVRAQKKIKAAGIPYRVPPRETWGERLGSVLAVLYLIFNEGYGATAGEAAGRADLAREAIRLTEALVPLAPDEPEIAGLLALMLFHDSRRATRSDATGATVPLDVQDRRLWDRDAIARADALLLDALRHSAPWPGPSRLQAAISGLHATAASFAATDWAEIGLLYARLLAVAPSPVVRLNAIAAASFRDGPEAALADLATLEEALANYQPYLATRADLLRRAGRPAEAAYRAAIAATRNAAERRFLEAQLAAVLRDAP
jgi:RNA polymerase sigma-70 factor (ECF subfamily)